MVGRLGVLLAWPGIHLGGRRLVVVVVEDLEDATVLLPCQTRRCLRALLRVKQLVMGRGGGGSGGGGGEWTVEPQVNWPDTTYLCTMYVP